MLRFWIAALLMTPIVQAQAETRYPARLDGHAFIPADTIAPAPSDAPPDARISGKFTGPARNDAPRSVIGRTSRAQGRRATGVNLPFPGQPVQGFSGFAMQPAEDGSILVVADNGFGAKRNSGDALLAFHRVAPDFETGAVVLRETAYLRDPDRVVPFRISYEATRERYLTGADFDPESIQRVGDEIWIGEEFGPHLLRATRAGVVTGVFPTDIAGAKLRSPDHPDLRIPSRRGRGWRVPRSGGFEGLALQPGAGLLWAMLEQPLLDASGAPEGDFRRALAFDPATRSWTGDSFKLRLAPGASAIGDLNFIDPSRALVIERDQGEGDPSLRCADAPAADCFPRPARLKRVVLIDIAARDADGFARRIGHIDLMDIDDPDGRARLPTDAARDLAGTFTFPFTTIEAVMRLDATRILVAADNNLPFSTGRKLDAAADTEFILLSVPEFLKAR